MGEPTQLTAAIWSTARELLRETEELINARGVTLIGLSLTNLSNFDDPLQLELPYNAASSTALDLAVDALRDRFGKAAVARPCYSATTLDSLFHSCPTNGISAGQRAAAPRPPLHRPKQSESKARRRRQGLCS